MKAGKTTASGTFVAVFEACVAILQVIVAMFRIGMAVFGCCVAIRTSCGGLRSCHGGLPRSRCDLKRRYGGLSQPQRVPAAETRGSPSAGPALLL
ncbi:hypothetical protein C6I21_04070 [Alkalicoccus urumqiensis]|uniref:Uncharacterized protein n=1 Tax=Alkalicoccus urumqiensis TaxID=1548213 RepID=A0A2P6MJS4_ALKUR|nr:hypothetical protein C6I21_04070 [Alkalicoccus urumqiensis]